jgi:hypothetical protein
MSKMETIIEILSREAARAAIAEECPNDSAYAWSGGNYEDAYYHGVEAGYIFFARDLLKVLADG